MSTDSQIGTDSSAGQLAPVAETARIESIDAVRGFALLGILLMNIQMFSMVGAAYFNPTAYGDLTGANYVVWYLSHLLADQKFMTIFSSLFGAGIVLMWQNAESKGRKAAGLHYRRTFWLLVFGAVHAYAMWSGDILFIYGLCSLWAFWFRRLSPTTLIIIGLILIMVSPGLFFMAGSTIEFWPPEATEGFEAGWQPTPEQIAEEVGNYRGGWLDQMPSRAQQSVGLHTGAFIFWGFWRVTGLMLIGMALFKLGFFSAEWSEKAYLTLLIVAILIGLPIVALGVRANFAAGWDISRFFLGPLYNYVTSLLVSMGWASGILLLCKRGALQGLTAAFANVGRMALTNYLLQTIICTTIFYGHGFGYFGSVSRVGQLLIVFGVWAFLIPFSSWWLQRFRFGPFEWLWRTLSYLKVQPMRRTTA